MRAHYAGRSRWEASHSPSCSASHCLHPHRAGSCIRPVDSGCDQRCLARRHHHRHRRRVPREPVDHEGRSHDHRERRDPEAAGVSRPVDHVRLGLRRRPGELRRPRRTAICIAGEVDLDTFEVTNPVSDTRIIGLHVDGFAASGIVQFGGEDSASSPTPLPTTTSTASSRSLSTGTQMIANSASGSGEAGLYVGDSPERRREGDCERPLAQPVRALRPRRTSR